MTLDTLGRDRQTDMWVVLQEMDLKNPVMVLQTKTKAKTKTKTRPPMAVVAFNVLPSPESEMSLSPLELINDEFKKRTAKEASRSVTK